LNVAQTCSLPYRGFIIRRALERLKFCRLRVGDTAQRGEDATKGARVCDPQTLCRPPSVLTNPARRSLSTCCGSQSRAPQNRRGPRRWGQILIDCKSALRGGPHAKHMPGGRPEARCFGGSLLVRERSVE